MKKIILVGAGCLVVLSAGVAKAEESPSPARYSIKQSDPDIGSHISRSIATHVIPFDKRYSELTPKQKAMVKSQYEQMGEEDEPPYPVNGLRSVIKATADGQQRLLVEGPLSMQVEIDSQGNPTSVAVLKSPSPEMTQFAAAVLML